MAGSGYSGTPLVKKLGLNTGVLALIHNSPKEYNLFIDEHPKGVKFVRDSTPSSLDFIHVFCYTKEDIQEVNEKMRPILKKDGLMWISWPKGSSSLKTELNRDIIREYFLANGLVDVKVASIDEDWSGLKFVYRLKAR